MIAVLASVALGMVAGLRTFTAPAALAWAARLGGVDMHGTALDWLGGTWAPWVCTLLAVAELAGDKSPRATSRKAWPALLARLSAGGFCAAVLALDAGLAWPGFALLGAGGAWLGTFGGHALRVRLAGYFGKDWPAAVLEDGLAIAMVAALIAGWVRWG